MATQITINNKTTQVPGVYATIRSGIVNPPSAADFGNVVIIDDGSLSTTPSLAISGVLGTNKSGAESVLQFNGATDLPIYVWDSELLPIIKSLYRPSRRQGVNGANVVTIIQAAETTPATTTVSFTNSTNGLKISTQFEGVSLNGTLVTKTFNPSDDTVLSNELGKGFAVKLEPGRSFGYSLVFYRGIADVQEDPLNPGYGFNEKALPDTTNNTASGTYNIIKPQVLFRSPDVKTLTELKKWLSKSNTFKKWFKLDEFIIGSTSDLIVAADITANYTALAPYALFTGGTTTYTDAAFQAALDLSKSLDNSFYLALSSKAQATNAHNTAIADLLTSGDLRWEKFMFVGAYENSDEFVGDSGTSQAVARHYDTSKVVAVHGAAKVANVEYPDGFRNISVLEKTAKVLGRTAGLPPQTPVSWKEIDIAAETHRLTEGDKEAAMSSGILCTYYNSELTAFVVLAGINTLGNNEFFINDDAQSYSIQIERIKSQLNKEIIFNATRVFFGKNTGPNRNTISAEDILAWTKGFLESKVATDLQDNLIVRVGAITSRLDQDNMYVEYSFSPNGEISKIIFTGVILDN